MNIEEIKMDYFENFEELIKTCKMWIRDDDIDAYYRFFEFNCMKALVTAYEKEKEKNKKAYRKANNYLYLNDSADYEVALWEVIRTLRPDLADKWDNGEDAVLEYIEEE